MPAGTGWSDSTSAEAYRGDHRKHASGTDTNSVSWTFGPLDAGEYQVLATWAPDTDRATNAPYTILDGAVSEATMRVNQQIAPTK